MRFDENSHQCHHQHNSGTKLSTPLKGPSAGAPPPSPHCPGGFPLPGTSRTGIPLRVSPRSGLSAWPNILDVPPPRSSCQGFFLFAVKCGFQRTKLLPRKVAAGLLPIQQRTGTSFSPSLYRHWVLLASVFARSSDEHEAPVAALSLRCLECRDGASFRLFVC